MAANQAVRRRPEVESVKLAQVSRVDPICVSLCLILGFASRLLAQDSNPELERNLRNVASWSAKPEEVERARQDLASNPDWLNSLAVDLAGLARTTRYHGELQQVEQSCPPEVRTLLERNDVRAFRDDPVLAEKQTSWIKRKNEVNEKIGKAFSAHRELDGKMRAFAYLASMDAVRLVAPLLSETSETIYGEDYAEGSIEDRAVEY